MMAYNFIIGPTDTDSISFCKPDMSLFSKDEQLKLLNEINDISPEFMDWDLDGYYDACLVLKAKNYILVKGSEYTYRGSSLKDTKREPAVREMLQVMIKDIIENESKNLISIYHTYIKEAMNVTDINRFMVKKTITRSVLEGNDEDSRLNERKVLTAIDEAVTRGVSGGYQEGDKVWLYEAIEGEKQVSIGGELAFYKDGRPKMVPNSILRDVRLWSRDHNWEHYVDRVYKTVEILANVVDMEQFVDYGLKRNKILLDNLK